MQDLIQKIEQWAEDRNIISGSKPIDQAMKLFSEFGELADNVGKGRDCRDDVGDVFVVLTIICKQTGCSILDQIATSNSDEDFTLKDEVYYLAKHITDMVEDIATLIKTVEADCYYAVESLQNICQISGYTLQECVQIAYNDIKDRKGIMHNGVFIKSTDSQYNYICKELGK